MHKYFASLLNRTISVGDKKVLGRWSLDYCNNKINNKIDWSNVDHCGPCGSEQKQIQIETKIELDHNDKNANK